MGGRMDGWMYRSGCSGCSGVPLSLVYTPYAPCVLLLASAPRLWTRGTRSVLPPGRCWTRVLYAPAPALVCLTPLRPGRLVLPPEKKNAVSDCAL